MTTSGPDIEAMEPGQVISTPFGQGQVLQYRELDDMVEIQLAFGRAYCKRSEMHKTNLAHSLQNFTPIKSQVTALDLNAMYESLEKMRRLNLELACQEKGIAFDQAALQECSQCLLEGCRASSHTNSKSKLLFEWQDSEEEKMTDQFPLLHKMLDAPLRQMQTPKPPKTCLICGAPTCPQHVSTSFGKEGITLCLPCEHLVSIDYIVECLTAPSPEDRLFLMDRMVDVYDRAVLLLRYSAQYVEEAAKGLEESMERTNNIAMGSSSAGVVSGMLGVCAAATILTPMGPPLLAASLVFGGSATVVQTGTDWRNNNSEPNQLADRIIALYGMVRSILQMTKTLRDIIRKDHLMSGMYSCDEDADAHAEACLASPMSKDRQLESCVMAGMTASRAAAASLELASASSSLAGNTENVLAEKTAMKAGLLNKSGMYFLRTVRAARFAGGALSVATVMLELKSLNDTLAQIEAGSPCEKAEMIRQISTEIDELPEKSVLFSDIERYLSVVARRRRNMTEDEVRQALRDNDLAVDLDNSVNPAEEEEDEGDEQSEDALPLMVDSRSLGGDALSDNQDNVDEDGTSHRQSFSSPFTAFKTPLWGQVNGSLGGVAASFQDGFQSLKTRADWIMDEITTEFELAKGGGNLDQALSEVDDNQVSTNNSSEESMASVLESLTA